MNCTRVATRQTALPPQLSKIIGFVVILCGLFCYNTDALHTSCHTSGGPATAAVKTELAVWSLCVVYDVTIQSHYTRAATCRASPATAAVKKNCLCGHCVWFLMLQYKRITHELPHVARARHAEDGKNKALRRRCGAAELICKNRMRDDRNRQYTNHQIDNTQITQIG